MGVYVQGGDKTKGPTHYIKYEQPLRFEKYNNIFLFIFDSTRV